MASDTAGTRCQASPSFRTSATAGLGGVGDEDDVGDVADIDRTAVAGGEEEVADLGRLLQRLAGDEVDLPAAVADGPGEEGAVGALDLGRELLERDAVERQPLGIGLDPDRLGLLADDVGEADVGQLRHLDLELAGEAGEAVGVPAFRRRGLGRKRDDDDRDIVDAAADDQRLGDADRDAVEIGAHLLVDAEDRGVRAGADQEARGDHGAVVGGLRIDVLDTVDALDDRLERLGDELHRVLGLEAVGRDVDVDHRHRDLRLLLARQRDQRDEAEGERGEQEERRERRVDERRGQPSGDAELHGTMTRSPGRRPVSTSTRGSPSASKAGPRITATSVAGSPARRT